jgi:hypothetical protein
MAIMAASRMVCVCDNAASSVSFSTEAIASLSASTARACCSIGTCRTHKKISREAKVQCSLGQGGPWTCSREGRKYRVFLVAASLENRDAKILAPHVAGFAEPVEHGQDIVTAEHEARCLFVVVDYVA